tara:strand:+ start:6792 stop:6995 length:204 start_codon:yes stop_codon:yes gene_type:complete
MRNRLKNPNRRSFIKNTSLITLTTGSAFAFPELVSGQDNSSVSEVNLVGPKEGFTPQIGSLVSIIFR